MKLRIAGWSVTVTENTMEFRKGPMRYHVNQGIGENLKVLPRESVIMGVRAFMSRIGIA